MRPGKFFNLFSNNSFDEPVEPVDQPVGPTEPVQNVEPVQDMPTFNPNETFNYEAPEQGYNRFDDNVNVFDNPGVVEPVNQPQVEPEESDELKEVIPQSLEASEVPTEQSEPQSGSNINIALEKIRNYAEELKKLGIDMNIEESDFENKYQITINIDK